MKGGAHSLSLVNRGEVHVHRWLPQCVCGWIGVPRRRRREAQELYRDHTRSLDRRRVVGRRPVALQACTPNDQLPEILRTENGP